MNYIAEANKFMYDDDYIVEATDLKKKIQHAFTMQQAAEKRGDKNAAEYWKNVWRRANDESKQEYNKSRHSDIDSSHITDASHRTQIAKAKKLLAYHKDNPEATKRGYEYAHDEHKKLFDKISNNIKNGKTNSSDDIAKLEQHNKDSNRAIKRHTGGIGIKDIKAATTNSAINKREEPKTAKTKYTPDDETYNEKHLNRSEDSLSAHDDEADSDDYWASVKKHGYDKGAHQKLHNQIRAMHKSGEEVPSELMSKLRQHTKKSIDTLHRV